MKRIITGILILVLLILPLVGCGTVALDNVSVEYDQDAEAFFIYKDPNVVYENVKLVLNHKYTLGSFTIDDDGPWILVWVKGFVDEDSKYFNSAEMKPTHFKISCDLADGKRGEYVEIWD